MTFPENHFIRLLLLSKQQIFPPSVLLHQTQNARWVALELLFIDGAEGAALWARSHVLLLRRAAHDTQQKALEFSVHIYLPQLCKISYLIHGILNRAYLPWRIECHGGCEKGTIQGKNKEQTESDHPD